ncbi:MAG TPA: efflux RND transporter periplasmic adaptor subunit [Polyangiaceae bacterium]|nr:efflux RND transporter periplasmic adaptor subunit [Polyangiaceae bacterium]
MTSKKTGLGRRLSTIVFVITLLGAAFAFRADLAAWFKGKTTDGVSGAAVSGSASTESARSNDARGGTAPGELAEAIDHYTCSMHPSVKQAAPGKCPICGMDLVPVTKDQQKQGVVMIDEARRQLIGVRTGKVVEAPLSRSFRAVGRVTYDESGLMDVNLKVGGWITKLFADRTGQHVNRGQPLFRFYSPELYGAEQDFLLAMRGGTTVATEATRSNRLELLGRAARQRLHLLGLTDAQIDAVEKSGTPSENIHVSSPASGFVIEKNVVDGASVEAGARLYRIAALNKVWVEAEVYEADLPHVHPGQAAKVTLDYLPGRTYDAKVSSVYPYLDPTVRTARVRVELRNEQLELRPGMYASVELASDAEPRVQVPTTAVVYTGPRRLVFIDLGDGRFKPQEVRVGVEANGMYEVLSGLNAGDTVATSGVFLIAAEARISTAAKYWNKEPEPANGDTSAGDSTRMRAAVYSCPMHPEVKSSTPGRCPKCGMNLEPAPSGAKQ